MLYIFPNLNHLTVESRHGKFFHYCRNENGLLIAALLTYLYSFSMAWFGRLVRTCLSCHKSAVLRLPSWCVYGPHISRSGRSAVTQGGTSQVSGREQQSESFVALGSGWVRLFENPGRSGAEENWSLFISISFLYLAAGWQVAGRVGVRCCQVVPVGSPPARRHTAPLLAGHAENAKYCCCTLFVLL